MQALLSASRQHSYRGRTVDIVWATYMNGDVIESNLSWNKDEMRKHIGHLFLFMKGEWQYSDNGIDWEPADEALPMPRGEVDYA